MTLESNGDHSARVSWQAVMIGFTEESITAYKVWLVTEVHLDIFGIVDPTKTNMTTSHNCFMLPFHLAGWGSAKQRGRQYFADF